MTPQIITEEQFQAMQTRARAGVAPMGEQVLRKDTVGGSSPLASSTYKSKWEAAYASKLELEQRADLVTFWKYEPFSLWLPGQVRYKPDFLVAQRTGEIEVIEVKGWSKNRRDGMTRLKIAAALFPCFVWRMVYRNERGGWDGEYV